ncbi:isoprenyl transferase [Methylocystis bryophila]|uniref:Isoprenyl transferase n=2 Tax=Methylocystis bryophila TaxID=655015 RepID=A0A1W6MZT1_9HYPH|nr:isoprenyl transferase [Methylocystis bryophila]ARN83056.1 di-trans,poly-cis-decaprenylcistransferase [Methylocystis bryophila]BDV39365.1 isoprenyl transferase 2 [Methylocystis bryophila]
MSDRDFAGLKDAAREGSAAAFQPMPRHVAVIMDGNGRWAARRGLPRIEGHRRGVDALRRAVRAAIELGIGYLTVYSFSVENWSRPKEEVQGLMGLLHRFIHNDLAELNANNVRVRVIGARAGLSGDVLALLRQAEEITRSNTGLTLVVAFNYGARQEIVSAARALAEAVAAGELSPAEVDADAIAARLYTSDIPDPDLIIRTSGEQRLSNFLLWQSAYAEFVFLPIHWPEFDKAALEAAIAEFAHRDRRFGGLESGMCNAKTAS